MDVSDEFEIVAVMTDYPHEWLPADRIDEAKGYVCRARVRDKRGRISETFAKSWMRWTGKDAHDENGRWEPVRIAIGANGFDTVWEKK